MRSGKVRWCAAGLLLGVMGPLAAGAARADAAPSVTIPVVAASETKRLTTVDDIVSIRKIPALRVSPDGRRYAIYVRQRDAKANIHRNGWFVGDVRGGALKYVGDAGETYFSVLPNGGTAGDLESPEVHWSPDNAWIAYRLRRNGEVQLWRSKADGSSQEQVSRNPSDVVNFAWTEDSKHLMFDVGATREKLEAQAERRYRNGYRYDEDLHSVWNLLSPHLRADPETSLAVWRVDLATGEERLATDAEKAEFKRARERQAAGTESTMNFMADAAVPPVANASGQLIWLKRTKSRSRYLQLVASRGSDPKDVVECTDERCTGIIQKVWWSEDGARALFLRYESEGRMPGFGLYAWSPKSGRAATVGHFPHDFFRYPQPAEGGRLLVVRETLTNPPHVAVIDEKSGKLSTLADVNPEFRNIRIGRVERIEWDAPTLAWNEPGGAMAGSYPSRNAGYILYPPDFDPSKKYPVFLDPYAVMGFSDSVGHEHPTQAYAAAGIIVLNAAFPGPTDVLATMGDSLMQKLYSEELDFPHMTMLSESTVRGLDTAAARGFIDTTRVGIGGVSHGTFIPLYIAQKHDRFTALSIAAGSWSPGEYYWPTRKGLEGMQGTDWRVKPVGKGAEYWKKLDIAEHVDQIEAPIIMHHALNEAHVAIRFMRHMADEGKPYDAYVYTDELHVKWQPAHLHSVMERNLDWFRFWLQDYEDPFEAKLEQYQKWRALREMQCKNPRSLRDYCGR